MRYGSQVSLVLLCEPEPMFKGFSAGDLLSRTALTLCSTRLLLLWSLKLALNVKS